MNTIIKVSQVLEKISLTGILAFWGAIISTIAITLNILRALNDRRKLKVEAFIGHLLPGDPEKHYFYTVITNAARRPIFVSGWGCTTERKDRSIMIIAKQLPKMLKESEYHIESTENLSIFRNKITSVYVWDSTGKHWKSKKKNFKKLMKDAKDLNLL